MADKLAYKLLHWDTTTGQWTIVLCQTPRQYFSMHVEQMTIIDALIQYVHTKLIKSFVIWFKLQREK